MIITPNHECITVYGTAVHGEGLVRMPAHVAASVSPAVADLATESSGIRLCFATDSQKILLKIRYSRIGRLHHMPLSGTAGFDLYEHLAAEESEALPPWAVDYRAPSGCVARWLHSFVIPFDAYTTMAAESEWEQPEPGLHQYTLYLPLYAAVRDLEIHLDDSATVEPHTMPYTLDKPVVFYGSSITQGGCACRPSNSYPAFISRMLHLDVINLGFSGNAKGEREMADYIATLDMAAFVYDYDHNAPDSAWLRATHAPFYQRLRAQCPELPILILTATTPARTHAQRALHIERRAIIRETYEAARASGDTRVAFLDMTECFYGPGCQSLCVDGTHPTDLGFERMAQWVAKPLVELLGL